jgi:nitrogen fixation protein NifU and related proteins
MAEGDSELQDLYREVLLDYFRSGAHKGKLDPADVKAHGINPVCGDELELFVKVDGGKIGAVRYAGHGCVISQASSAMLAEAVEGRTIPRAQELVKAFKDMMLSKAPLESLPEELESLRSLEGVRRFPTRIKCATLAWNTLSQGLQSKNAPGEFEEVE